MKTGATKAERLEFVKEQIRAACLQAGRKEKDVLLLAVSKTKSATDVKDFFELGQCAFGENYIQEALKKIESFQEETKKPEWHFIGNLQSNKAKFIPGNFALVHSLDTLSLARKLNTQAAQHGQKIGALIEVNLHGELSKGGMENSQLPVFLESLAQLTELEIRGLMCIPDPRSQTKDPRRSFASLREILEKLNRSGAYPHKLVELSMGMSTDFREAILEGSTIVRIGTLLFGERG